MAVNRTLYTAESRLAREIREGKRAAEGMKTTQIIGDDSVNPDQLPSVFGSYDAVLNTVTANTQRVTTFKFRTSRLAPSMIDGMVYVNVDTDDDDHHFPDGGSLTAGQLKLFYSLTRDWQYGQVSQDPRNNCVWHFQLWNLDSNTHTYYVHFSAYSHQGLLPLTLM